MICAEWCGLSIIIRHVRKTPAHGAAKTCANRWSGLGAECEGRRARRRLFGSRRKAIAMLRLNDMRRMVRIIDYYSAYLRNPAHGAAKTCANRRSWLGAECEGRRARRHLFGSLRKAIAMLRLNDMRRMVRIIDYYSACSQNPGAWRGENMRKPMVGAWRGVRGAPGTPAFVRQPAQSYCNGAFE